MCLRLACNVLMAVALPLALASTGTAQQPPEEVPPPPADQVPPPPAPAAEPTPPAPAPVAPASCVPPCRAGFACYQGQCMSACNPPCAAGEQCTESGACVLTAAPLMPEYDPAPMAMPPPAGVHQHDGFMLRLALGFGSGTMTEEITDGDLGVLSDLEASGFAVGFSIDVGGSLTDNLVLHGRISYLVIGSPDVVIDGMESFEADDMDLAGILFGVGLTYYFMPINLYLTGVVGPAQIRLNVDGAGRRGTDTGLGFNLDVGKEWWVGDDWGIGVALRIWYNTVSEEDSGIEGTVDLTGGALLFSATYQ